MRLRDRTVRRGLTFVETAITILVFLTLVLGMLDLGVGVLRHSILSESARNGVRQAIVHGSLAPAGWNGGPWGPATIDVPATAVGIPIVDEVQPLLAGLDLGQTRINVEWSDGGNDVGQQVRVRIRTPYQPIMTFIFGNPTFTLQAASTMAIAH